MRAHDEARLDRWLDDPREEQQSRAELEERAHRPAGRCQSCGAHRMQPDGPCTLGGLEDCPIISHRRAVAG